VERVLNEFTRMQGESQRLRDELPQLRPVDQAWVMGLRQRESAEADIVAHRPVTAVA
jgi:hypothetical protein